MIKNMNITLFEPELAQNVGSIIRICACFQCELNIIRPTSFIWDEKKIKHSALDYLNDIKINFFDSFQEFKKQQNGRIIAATCAQNAIHYKKFQFENNDIILMGKESSGLTEEIINNTNERITIPIKNRSLNLAVATGIIIAHAKT